MTASSVHIRRRMSSTADDLRARTKRFAFDVINLVKHLPRDAAAEPLARQLIRAATGVASNHRAACRARSRREFIARLGVVLEEADESELWLEALIVCELAPGVPVAPLCREAGELRAIFSQSVRTARQRGAKL
ncbi:MAG: four helix bundle protein [Acidobacteria bacterium]|nr:four helix bundle protein [Acidobacteriota bacterium]